MKMKEVIAVFDIGKTNKKIFLFDSKFSVVYKNLIRFEETLDDDNFPCDDIELIENWLKSQIESIQKEGFFKIKAINFSTHGASLIYLDKNGKRITPLYNYLKPLGDFDFISLYNKYDGVEEFSRKTASPAYGMLNAGLQIYWLKKTKPHYWERVDSILHYPQYLSFLFSNKISADYTSVGAHTATWDFDAMKYHSWLHSENISLTEPSSGNIATIKDINGETIAIGTGLHDSSSSIIPLLQKNTTSREFVLLSTGTWIICMNPFSKETLTQFQLKNDCLCFMTPEKQQIKSSMQFLGKVHEVNALEISTYFGVEKNHYLELTLNKKLCEKIFLKDENVFFENKIPKDHKGDLNQLNNYKTYETAYYQLIFEISKRVHKGVKLILDANNNLKDVFISGGFNKNDIFVEFLSLMMPEQKIQFPNWKNASALGAALQMKDYFKKQLQILKNVKRNFSINKPGAFKSII